MSDSGRARARMWPYPRHHEFEKGLRKAASAWFKDKGFAVSARYPYILANREEWSQNIILPEVAQYVREEHARRETLRQGFPLHKYVHHGLSSQAMIFNLVGPLIVTKDLDPLRQAFTRQGIAWPEGEVSASFEYKDRAVFNEDTGQPTSIDLVLKDDSGQCLSRKIIVPDAPAGLTNPADFRAVGLDLAIQAERVGTI